MKAMTIKGLPVSDAKKMVSVSVSRNDVTYGARKDADNCAMARALCLADQCDEAIVNLSRAYLRKGNKWTRYVVSSALRTEIAAFDRGGKFEPGEYVLHPVQPTQRLDTLKTTRERAAARAKDKAKKRDGSRPETGVRLKKPYHVITGVRARMNPHGRPERKFV